MTKVALTWLQLIEKAKKEIREAPTDELAQDLKNGEVVLIDIREQEEFLGGHIPGSVFIPRGFLELRIESVLPDRMRKIWLYCGGGNRSALAARSLQEMGYCNVVSLRGGFSQWRKEDRPAVFPREPESDS